MIFHTVNTCFMLLFGILQKPNFKCESGLAPTVKSKQMRIAAEAWNF